MKTYSATPKEVVKKWYLVDATDLVLGRLASLIAMRLRGKHKPMYSPNIDCGDHIVVINAEKVLLTGNKLADKVYYRHTGHPGGIKSQTAKQIIEGKYPERVLMKAVQRMLPKGILGREQLTKLKVYGGSEHPHTAQTPEVIDVRSMNPKNARRV